MKFLLVLSVLLTIGAWSAEGQYPYQSYCPPARPGCICPQVFDPVCSTTGCTYGNACQLECAGGQLAYYGECASSYPQIPSIPTYPRNSCNCRCF